MEFKIHYTDPPDMSDEARALRDEFPPGSEVMMSIDKGPIETWYIVGIAMSGKKATLMISPISPIMVPENKVEELIARTIPLDPEKLRGKQMRMQ